MNYPIELTQEEAKLILEAIELAKQPVISNNQSLFTLIQLQESMKAKFAAIEQANKVEVDKSDLDNE